MIHSYRIKDIRVTTYDGAVLLMQLDSIFQGPRLKIENMILDALRPRMKNAAHDCTVRRGMIYDSTPGEATIKLMKP